MGTTPPHLRQAVARQAHAVGRAARRRGRAVAGGRARRAGRRHGRAVLRRGGGGEGRGGRVAPVLSERMACPVVLPIPHQHPPPAGGRSPRCGGRSGQPAPGGPRCCRRRAAAAAGAGGSLAPGEGQEERGGRQEGWRGRQEAGVGCRSSVHAACDASWLTRERSLALHGAGPQHSAARHAPAASRRGGAAKVRHSSNRARHGGARRGTHPRLVVGAVLGRHHRVATGAAAGRLRAGHRRGGKGGVRKVGGQAGGGGTEWKSAGKDSGRQVAHNPPPPPRPALVLQHPSAPAPAA